MIEKLKKQKVLIATVLINICSLLLLLLLFSPRYQAKQDVIMQALVYGINGETTSRLIFSNILIGKFLTLLTAIGQGPWYILFQYVLVFISLNVIIFITLKRNYNIIGKTISAIIMVFIGYDCYILPQYMKTAALLMITATYIIFYVVEGERHRIWSFIALFLVVLGSLISFNTYILVGLFCLFEIFIFYLKDKKIGWVKKNVILLLLCIVLPLCFKGYDNYFYQNHTDEKENLEYRDTLVRMYDFGMPEYTEESLVGETTYDILKDGMIADFNEITPSVFKAVVQNEKELNVNSVYKFFRTIPIKAFKIGMFYAWLFLSLMLIVSKERKKKYLLFSMIGCGNTFFFLLFLFNALNYFWMGTIGFLTLILILLMSVNEIDLSEMRGIWGYSIILCLILYNNFSSQFISHSSSSDVVEYWMEEMKSDGQNAYIVELNSILKGCSVFWDYPKGMVQMDNIFFLNAEYVLGSNGFKWNSIEDIQLGDFKEIYLVLPDNISSNLVITDIGDKLPNAYSAEQVDVINDAVLYRILFY